MALLDDLVKYDDRRRCDPRQADRRRASNSRARGACSGPGPESSPGSPRLPPRCWRSTASVTAPQAQGKNLKLQLGYSHDVNSPCRKVSRSRPRTTTVEISGIDKQQVGQVAAEIRRWRKPEPYKGKGIKYRGEYIFRKEGKKK